MPTEIRIAHVAPQLETGGLERLLVEFARHADRGRYSLVFVALGSRGSVADDLEACGWPVMAMNAGPGVRPVAIYGLMRLFRERGIDVVHSHNTRSLLYAGPAAKLAGARVVHTRHGQRQGGTGRQDALVGLASRCVDRLVCVSEDAMRLSGRDGIGGGSACTIWNGIDLERFTCTALATDGPALFVGRLSPEKDIATLLRAVAIVVMRRPAFRLDIAGAGPCSGELSALAESLGVDRNVRFHGEVRDVPALLRGASMLVLPSLTEGLPLTVLEAMACGLPVVATRVGGTPEAVIGGETGLLVEAGRPDMLADAMERVAHDPEMARRMGAAGHQRIVEHFDVRTMLSRYESLYESVLEGRNGRFTDFSLRRTA
jgi:glycosyltransferase involved in cell wall biosynthesis